MILLTAFNNIGQGVYFNVLPSAAYYDCMQYCILIYGPRMLIAN